MFVLCLSVGKTDTATGQGVSDRKLLAPTYPLAALEEIIVPRLDWKPFPSVSRPEGFEQIPARVRQAYIKEAEKLLGENWEPLPASVFLEYVRTGNRSHYESLSFRRRKHLAFLALAEAFEQKGRFLDQIVNGIWAISEESFWGVPAHIGSQKAGSGLPDVAEPVVDLFAAETAALLAWTHYLLGPELDRINPLITQRIEQETDRRILTPYLEREDWGWMGFAWKKRTGYVRPVNNWNPWINSNVLACALILEKDPERRLRLVHKVMESVDAFIEPYPSDGGCDEGPSYWSRAGGSLYDVLELLYSASNGKISLFDQPLIAEIGRYIARAYISEPYFINFADASAVLQAEPSLIYRYGEAVGDEMLMGFGAFAAKVQDYGSEVLPGNFGYLNRTLPALFNLTALQAAAPAEPLLRDVWLHDLQVMAARSERGSTRGFYVAAKGGHNAESHNHNDVGNYIVYHDGHPVLVDAGAQTYTAKTFSNRRYELWNNQSSYHTLPEINGVMQKEGRSYEAREVKYEQDDQKATLSLEMAGAYPDEAQAATWGRTITLNRGKNVAVTDTYQLSTFVEPLRLNFLSPLQPSEAEAGRVRLSGAEDAYDLVYDPDRFQPSFETIPIEDERMTGSWGSRLFRIVLTSRKPVDSDRFEIRVEPAAAR